MAQGGGGLRGGVSRLALAEARSRHSAGGAGYIPGLRVETSPLAGKGKKAIGLDAGVCVCGGECGHMDHDRCYGSPSARAPASVPLTLPENREYLTVCHLSTAGLTLRSIPDTRTGAARGAGRAGRFPVSRRPRPLQGRKHRDTCLGSQSRVWRGQALALPKGFRGPLGPGEGSPPQAALDQREGGWMNRCDP